MKTFKILLAGAVALMAFAGCENTDELVDTTPVYDDAYYASHASISSSDSNFTSNSTGGSIHFKVEGGEVKVFVSCGTEWSVQNNNPTSFNAYIEDSYYLTVSAEQNYVEEELTGTITLTTAEMHIAFASITVTQNAYGAPEITVDANEWHVPAVGELTTELVVESTDEWTVDGGDEWLIVEKSETGLKLTAEENKDTEERATEIVLTCTDGYNSDSETITVTQDGLAYITLSEEELSLPQFGDTVSVKVESNFDYECTYDSGWLTIEKDEDAGGLAITYTTNETGKERECTVAITAGDGASNVAKAELTITQVAHSLTVETTEWHAPAVGELTKEIGVEAPADWSAETKVDWLTVEKTETGIILTANENVETTERNGEVVLSYTDELHFDSETITVTQDGLAYIELSEETLLLSKFESTTSVTVESNFDWDYSYDTTRDWLTIEKDVEDSSLKITYTENETVSDREVVVNITAGDGAENLAEAQLSITQSCENTDALILEYRITSSSTEIYLPIRDFTNVTIDWDDGKTTTTSSDYPSHTYSTPGIYTVTINGKLNGLSYGRHTVGSTYLAEVKQWGDNDFTSMEFAFYGCSSLTSLPDGAGPFSNVTSFLWAFYGCSSLEKIPEGLFNSCQSVTDFSYCFYGCSGLTSLPTGLFDNCADVTDFSYCFYGCSGLTSLPSDLFASCVAVTDFSYCFCRCSGLTSLPSGLFDNCPNVTSFSSCFYYCTGLTSLPSSLFDNCPNVTSFSSCFYYCSGLTSLPYNLFLNCKNVTTFGSCFDSCSSLVSAPSFEGLSKVTVFRSCFYGCSSLVSPPSFKDCSSAVTSSNSSKDSFYRTFYGCDKLVIAPSFEGCSGITSVPDFITDKRTWTTLPENMFSGCSKITSFSQCFYGCTALETVPKGLFSGCTAATSFASCFGNCTALETVLDALFSGCTAATSFSSVFYNCSSLKSVAVNVFDGTSAAVDFSSAFYGCSSVVGESPYTEFEINGENMKIHLYERGDYYLEIRHSRPTSYSNCFTNSTFSDINSIPSSWGGNGN